MYQLNYAVHKNWQHDHIWITDLPFCGNIRPYCEKQSKGSHSQKEKIYSLDFCFGEMVKIIGHGLTPQVRQSPFSNIL